VSGKLLIYAGSANPCNAQKHPTAHLMSSKAVRVRSSALCLPAKRAKMGSAQYSYRRLCQRHVSNRPSPRATVVGQKPLLLWGPPMPKAAFYNGADEDRARRGRRATSSWGAKGVRSRSEGPCFEDCMYRLLGSKRPPAAPKRRGSYADRHTNVVHLGMRLCIRMFDTWRDPEGEILLRTPLLCTQGKRSRGRER
jgi:hypothetical protein